MSQGQLPKHGTLSRLPLGGTVTRCCGQCRCGSRGQRELGGPNAVRAGAGQEHERRREEYVLVTKRVGYLRLEFAAEEGGRVMQGSFHL